MKKRITQNFSKRIKFIRNDTQKEERIEKEEAWEISKLKPIWTKMERKREKENKNSLY